MVGEGSSKPSCAVGIRFLYTYTLSSPFAFVSSKSLKQPSAEAVVTKDPSCDVTDPYSLFTKITTDGYNNDTPGDTRRVERGLEVNY